MSRIPGLAIYCRWICRVPSGRRGSNDRCGNILEATAFGILLGLAIVAYFFHKNNVPRFLRSATYILIIFQQIFALLVAALGLFDLWGDFRRLKKKNLTPSQAS